MKKFLVGILSVLLLMGLTVSLVSAANTVSFGTTGVGATAIQSGSTVELFTPDGAAGSAYIRLEIPGGIELDDIGSLSYTAQVLNPDTSGFAPEVVLNIDADGDGVLEGTGVDWMQSGHNPSALNGDNFLSGDNWPVSALVADGGMVNRNALGDYMYWSANDARDGLSFTLYSPFGSIGFPQHDIDETDRVYSIDFIAGTSGSFNNLRVLFESVELNETTYPVSVPQPTPTPTTDVCANIDGDQSGVPDGLHLDASGQNCVAFQFGGAPPPPAGAVLAGQVLGATTLGATGGVEENIFLALFALGSILVGTGVRKLGVPKE